MCSREADARDNIESDNASWEQMMVDTDGWHGLEADDDAPRRLTLTIAMATILRGEQPHRTHFC